MNFLDGKVAGGKVQLGGSAIDLQRPAGAEGSPVTFGVRPEHITLREGSGIKLADVRIDLVEHLGGSTMLYATTTDGQPLTIAMEGQQQIALGTNVIAHVDPARTHVFGADGKAT